MSKKVFKIARLSAILAFALPVLASCGKGSSVLPSATPSSEGTSQPTSEAQPASSISEEVVSASSEVVVPSTEEVKKGSVIINSVAGGTVTADVEEAEIGADVTFTIVADSGYLVAGLSVNNVAHPLADLTLVEEGKYTFTTAMVEGGLTAKGSFDKLNGINIIAATGGTVTTNKTEAKDGEEVEVTISVDSGYRLGGLKVDSVLVSVDELTKDGEVYKHTVTMDGDGLILEGVFAEIKAVTVTAVEGGSVTVDKTEGIAGETVKVSVAMEGSNAFLGLEVNGQTKTKDTLTKDGDDYVLTIGEDGLAIKGIFLTAADTVTISFPELGEDDVPAAYVGEVIDLYEWEVKNANGLDVTNEVTVTISDENDEHALITEEEIKSSVSGYHNVVYTAKLGDDVVGVKKLKVLFARKLYVGGKSDWVVNDMLPDEEQTIVYTNDGMGYLELPIAASNYYYVEYTVTDVNYAGRIGFAHFDGDSTATQAPRGMLKTTLEPSKKGVVRGYNAQANVWSEGGTAEYHENLDKSNYQFSDEAMKFGVARVGDFFYTFINDQYEGATQAPKLVGVNSRVAIWGNAYDAGAGGEDEGDHKNITLSHIQMLKGETDVRAKVDALTSSGMIKPYVANTQYWSHDPSKFEFGKNEELGEYVKLLANDVAQNSSIVSNWASYEGDFTFEFDYNFESTSRPEGADDGRLQIEVRPWAYGGEIFQFGCKYSKSQFMMDPPKDPTDGVYTNINGGSMTVDLGGRWSAQYNWSDTAKWGGVAYDDSKGTHYKVSRTLQDDGSTVIKTTINSINTPTQTYTRTFTITGMSSNVLRVTVTNKCVKGVLSNFQYTK